MTAEEFLAFYPQFTAAPSAALTACVTQAAARFTEMGEDAEEARRLYTAHKLTLYMRSIPAVSGSSASPSELAAAGDPGRAVSKRVGEVQVAYAAGTSFLPGLPDLSETLYGLQLATLLRLRRRPEYVP